jgi:MFS family permease
VNREALLIGCALGGALGAGALPLAIHAGWLLWVALFLWGGVFAGVYTVALIILGERFRGAALATGNAAFGFFWGIGGLLGPAVAGAAMDVWDPHGLPATLCTASLVFVLLGIGRRLNSRAASA